MKEITVSKSFSRLAEEFNRHDQQAGQSFIAMLNTQEAAKLEYQDVTGKVHGFNPAWAEATGKSIRTIEEYNRLAKQTVELRKNGGDLGLSGQALRAYALASNETKSLVKERAARGEHITARQVQDMETATSKVENPESRQLYVLTNPSCLGWVKIGMAKDIDNRLANFKAGSPFPYKVEMLADLPEGMRDLSIHDYAKAEADAVSGEWFQMPVQAAINLVERQLKPLQLATI